MTNASPLAKRHNFTGNDVATSFSYTKKISNQDHIKLVHTDTAGLENALADPLKVDVDYTVNGVGDAGGGSVDFPKAGSVYSTLATGEKLSIIYDFPTEQQLDVPNTGRVFNVDVEDQLDYITNLISQSEELLDRALTLPEGSTLTGITFPEGISAANRALKGARWNTLGTALELITFTSGANIDPIAVKGDIVQGDVNGDAAKLAIGGTGAILHVVTGLLAYLAIGAEGSTLQVESGVLNYLPVGTDGSFYSVWDGDGKPSWSQLGKIGADVGSDTALPLLKDGVANDVTGSTTITSFASIGVGAIKVLTFTGALILTHDATNLILYNATNITTIAGDVGVFHEYGSGTWRLIGWNGHVLEHTHASAAQGGVQKNGVIQIVNVMDGAVATGTTALTADDSFPENDEGDEFMTLAITPTNASNKLKIDVVVNLTHSVANAITVVALFQDSTTNSLAAISPHSATTSANHPKNLSFTHFMAAGTTSATTFKVRMGTGSGGTLTFNGISGSRILAGIMASSITITELKT